MNMELPSFSFNVHGKVEVVAGENPKLIVTVEVPPFEVAECYRGLKMAQYKVETPARTFEIPITTGMNIEDKNWNIDTVTSLSCVLIDRLLKDDLKLPKSIGKPRQTKNEFVLECARRLWSADKKTQTMTFSRLNQTELAKRFGREPGYLKKRRDLHGIKTNDELLDLAFKIARHPPGARIVSMWRKRPR